MTDIQKNDLIFLPLGGSGEIGMNANLYHYQGRWLMIDLGISFPDTMPGVDVVLPDLRFIEERSDKLEAIILTHAHEDHFGAIPCYGSVCKCQYMAPPLRWLYCASCRSTA